MNKIFLFAKHAKTGENCNKFSESVSSETLVGGTTTAGRDYKQTQRLSKGSASAPLTAVGTLTSQLCCSAKVVEKSLHRHSEPQAKNPEKTKTVMPDLIGHLSRIKKEVAEVLGSRLSSCPRMTSKVLSLRGAVGDVAIPRVKALSLRGGLMSDEAIFQAVLKMVQRLLSRCRKNVEDCRVSAMHFLAMTPSTLTLAAVVAIGMLSESRAEIASAEDCGTHTGNAFFDQQSALGNNCQWSITDEGVLIISKKVSSQTASMGYYFANLPWSQWQSQIRAVVFDGVSTSDTHSLWSWLANTVPAIIVNGGASVSGHNTTYQNKRTDCAEGSDLNTCLLSLDTDYGCANGYLRKGNTCIEETTGCGSDLQKKGHCIDPAEGCGANYLRKGNKCISAAQGCGTSFKENDGECDRIRYTPAEAAQYLKDTDNEIIMTFKVNR